MPNHLLGRWLACPLCVRVEREEEVVRWLLWMGVKPAGALLLLLLLLLLLVLLQLLLLLLLVLLQLLL